MEKSIARAKIVFIVLAAGLLCQPAPAVASGLSVEPISQKVTILAEEPSVSFTVRLINDSNVPQVARLAAVDFGQLGETGGIQFLGQPGDLIERQYGLAAWLVFEQDSLIVPALASVDANVTVVNKQSLSPGGHYAAIIASFDTEEAEADGSQVDLKAALSSLVFVTKTGGEVYQLSLGRAVQPPSWWKITETIHLEFISSGNVHTIPRGRVTITDWRGRLVASGTINKGSLPILPERIRTMPVDLSFARFPVMPGPYTLTVEWRHDEQEEFTHYRDVFVFVGAYAVAMVLLILTAGWWIVGRIRGR